jgi:hypothetical protein
MKVLSVIVLGVVALGVVTFKSVASLPKLKPAAGTPFDWQQFLPGGKIFNFSVSFFYRFCTVCRPAKYNVNVHVLPHNYQQQNCFQDNTVYFFVKCT